MCKEALQNYVGLDTKKINLNLPDDFIELICWADERKGEGYF